MKFYCERQEEYVDSEDCKDECDAFEDCKKSGYFNGIHSNLGASSKNLRIQALAKMCQRATNHEYLKPYKEKACFSALTGVTQKELPGDS